MPVFFLGLLTKIVLFSEIVENGVKFVVLNINSVLGAGYCYIYKVLLVTDNPFEILEDVKILSDGKFNGHIASFYVLFVDIAAIGIVSSLILCGHKLTYTKNPSERDSCKKELAWKGLLSIIIFGFTYFLNVLYFISKDIV